MAPRALRPPLVPSQRACTGTFTSLPRRWRPHSKAQAPFGQSARPGDAGPEDDHLGAAAADLRAAAADI